MKMMVLGRWIRFLGGPPVVKLSVLAAIANASARCLLAGGPPIVKRARDGASSALQQGLLVKTTIGHFGKTHGEERSAGGRPRDGGRNQRRAGCRVTLTHPVHHAGACREHMGLHCRVAAGVPCAVTSQKLVILQQATGACAHDLYQC